jgi:H+/Na+-translocating ferredoxin:NAD+ oxidoreductase subunit B
MLAAVVMLAGLALALTALLIAAARLVHDDDGGAVTQIEKLLPRIQCAQCGYPGCRPYAAAIVAGAADINRCPPGGVETIQRLADLLGRDAPPLDASRGHASLARVALIDEQECVGCNLCARACPVDAIVGVPQMMHTVILAHCTGCELCLSHCPVDCIAMVARSG